MTEGREGNMEISKNDAYAVVAVIRALHGFYHLLSFICDAITVIDGEVIAVADAVFIRQR